MSRGHHFLDPIFLEDLRNDTFRNLRGGAQFDIDGDGMTCCWDGYRKHKSLTGIDSEVVCAKCHSAWGDGACLICGYDLYIHSTWVKFFDSGKSLWEYEIDPILGKNYGKS